MIKNYYTIILLFLSYFPIKAQNKIFTHQDSLRGSITEERKWWDLKYYQLDMEVNPKDSTIRGRNLIRYQPIENGSILQVDLQEPMRITSVRQNKEFLNYRRDGNAYFIELNKESKKDEIKDITVEFEGKPRVSENPPWSGGFVWEKDPNGNDFIATACQGDGASMWWANKDHMYDEVDSMDILVKAPKSLVAVSNGKLVAVRENSDDTKTYHWSVKNPINNYGVNINLANYTNFSEIYKGEKGDLICNYYVLKSNLKKAKKQFKQVPKMLKALEHWFGPYPFYEDDYKIVEVPYLGMEHQSSVTYGNGFQNGYKGRDLSGTGWGLKFDFIIIHESGHEWFANSITNRDIADMWIHESFTSYSETLYLDYHFGTKAGNEYLIGTRKNIRNDRPIIGEYEVNHAGSGDMYFKGANMLHTLRQLVDDDQKWRSILRKLSSTFYHQTVSTEQIETFLATETKLDLNAFFDQYLRSTNIPTFEYKLEKGKLSYRWINVEKGFNMPLKVKFNKKHEILVQPSLAWKSLGINPKYSSLEVDDNFYVKTIIS